jgi:hypothetical protein
MTSIIRSSLAAVAMLLATGCASLPPPKDGGTPAGYREIRNEPHYRLALRPGEAAWPLPPLFRLPQATVSEGAIGTGITPEQAAVVATHAARSMCLALAPWMQWTTAEEGGRILLQVQRIGASNSELAATSAVLDALVPGPFRLPAGLGTLEVNTRVEDAAGASVLDVRWARGANPLIHRARVSTIGDAWELAPSNARDLVAELAPLKLARQPDPVRKANVAACDERFGRVSVAGRAASMFVPFSPEAIDPSDDTPEPTPAPQP